MRDIVMGSEAQITQSGLINPEHGCVVTTTSALEYAVKKAEIDKKKREAGKWARRRREMNATRRNEVPRMQKITLETARDKRREILRGESLEVYRI